MEYVRCAICADEVEQMTESHTLQHGMTFADYKARYPNAPTITDALRSRLKWECLKRNQARRTPRPDDITCHICDARLSVITSKHLEIHGISLDEYRTRFPDASLVSLSTKQRKAERAREHSQRMTGDGNSFAGKMHTATSKKRMSAGHKIQWERDREHLLASPQFQKGEQHPQYKAIKVRSPRSFHSKMNRARRRSIERYGHRCMVPGCDFTFAVANHHIEPRRQGGLHGIENCILLCPNHHALADANILTSNELLIILAQEWERLGIIPDQLAS